MKDKMPVFCILLAGTLWGCISIFLNGLYSEGLTAVGVSSVRMTFAAVIYVLFLLITDRRKLKIKFKDIWMFALSGIVSVAFFNFLYTYTVVNCQASVAVVLLYTSPIFTIILSAIFFKEKITIKKLIALVGVSIGCIIVSGIIGGSYRISLAVLLTGLGSGLFWGAYTIFSRISLRKYSSATASVWSVILAGIVMVPFGIKEGIPGQIAASPSIALWGIGIAVVSTVAPYALYTYGLQHVESGKASIIVTVELVVGNIVGMVIFGEPHDFLKIVGIIICTVSVVFLNIEFTGKKRETN